MVKRILRWLFPNPLAEYIRQQEMEKARIRRIKESFTPEQHESAARIVAMHNEERSRSGGYSSSGSSRSSSSRSDSSCTRFDD